MATIRIGKGSTVNKGIAKGPMTSSSTSTVKRKPCKTCGGRK